MKGSSDFNGILILILTLLSPVATLGQVSADKALNETNIVAPTAAGLGKYVDCPVNLHTGIPDISIPIYTIAEGPLAVPVSLSYNASGIKVAELASWVGLGWSLNAGGVISRTVRGRPDEKTRDNFGYYQNHGYPNYMMNSMNELDYTGFALGNKDGEPDLFFFNFNGYSGKFFIREDNVPVMIPHQNIVFKPVFCGESEAGCNRSIEFLRSWEVTTPDGIKYYFGMSMDDAYGDPAIEKTHPQTETNGQYIANVISSWYLYRIESADGRFSVRFKYAKEEYSYFSLSQGRHMLNDGPTEYQILIKNNVDGVRLTDIIFGQGALKFNPQSAARQDLGGYKGTLAQGTNTQSKALESIEINNNEGFCKRYDFDYSYFIADNSQLQGVLKGYEKKFNMTADRKRLKLNSIQERSCSGSIVNPKTKFTYFEEVPLPSTLSFAVDHWGYYNGQNSNQLFTPKVSTDNGLTYLHIGSDRESRWPQMKAGSLASIRHPTGGYTEFEFGHDEIVIHPSSGGGTPVTSLIGGLRIDKVISKDGQNSAVLTKLYDYPAGVTLFSIPSYIFKVRNQILVIDYENNGVANGCIGKMPDAGPYEYVTSSSSVHPLRTTLGSHKGYETIKVIQADGGYSLYTYDVSGAPDVTKGVSVRAINVNECTGTEPLYPPVPENQPLRRGALLKEQHFAFGKASPVKEVIYDPVFVEDRVGAHGLVVGALYAGFQELFPPTEYQLKSGRKTSETRIEKVFDDLTGEAREIKTKTTYGSIFHNFPTAITTFAGAEANAPVFTEKKIAYAKDFSPCNKDIFKLDSTYNRALDRAHYIYQLNLDRCKTQEGRSLICEGLKGCGSRPGSPCSSEDVCRFCAFTDREAEITAIRKTYINNLVGVRESDCINTLAPVQDPAYQSLLDLNKQNDVGKEVELSEWKYGKLVKSTVVKYAKENNNVYPQTIFQTDINNPLSNSEFSAAEVWENAFLTDNNYSSEAETTYKYDRDRLVEVKNKKGMLMSYIWDASGKYPLVKAEGLSFDALLEAFHLAETHGGVGSIDYNQQLRILAGKALVTTYSFKDMLGVSTITDPNNLTTFYEYDSLGRLKNIKDHQGNIVKHYTYSFNKSN